VKVDQVTLDRFKGEGEEEGDVGGCDKRQGGVSLPVIFGLRARGQETTAPAHLPR